MFSQATLRDAAMFVSTMVDLNWGKSLDNQNILWATKPSLVVAPGATGHKSKFRTLTRYIVVDHKPLHWHEKLGAVWFASAVV